MKVATGIALTVVSTVLLTVFAIASMLDPPVTLDSRNTLIWAIGGAGLVFAYLAVRELRALGNPIAEASA